MEAVDYAVSRDDIQHLIIDNVQFLLHQLFPSSVTETGYGVEGNTATSSNKTQRKTPKKNQSFFSERLELQDIVVEQFRRLATEKNVSQIQKPCLTT
jgi:hypothetical protein